jgi:hypothetical protein
MAISAEGGVRQPSSSGRQAEPAASGGALCQPAAAGGQGAGGFSSPSLSQSLQCTPRGLQAATGGAPHLPAIAGPLTSHEARPGVTYF